MSLPRMVVTLNIKIITFWTLLLSSVDSDYNLENHEITRWTREIEKKNWHSNKDTRFESSLFLFCDIICRFWQTSSWAVSYRQRGGTSHSRTLHGSSLCKEVLSEKLIYIIIMTAFLSPTCPYSTITHQNIFYERGLWKQSNYISADPHCHVATQPRLQSI